MSTAVLAESAPFLSSGPSVRDRVNKLLRLADESVRAGQYDRGLTLVRNVFSLDPRNMYARAYEERILSLKLEQERSVLEQQAEQRANARVEEEIRRRMREFYRTAWMDSSKHRQAIAAEEDLEAGARQSALAEERTVAAEITSATEEAITARTRELDARLRKHIDHLVLRAQAAGDPSLQETLSRDLEAFRQAVTENLDQRDAATREAVRMVRETLERERQRLGAAAEEGARAAHVRQAELERAKARSAYRSLLASLQHSGIAESLQNEIAAAVRGPLEIDEAEHAKLRRMVELAAYIAALREHWKRGGPTAEEERTLAQLRKLYAITDEEHAGLTRDVRAELGVPDASSVILAVDDDPTVLKFLVHILQQSFRTVLSAGDVASAVRLAAEQAPDLIICDLHLGAEEVSGVTFYEHLRRGDHGAALRRVPFVLMSSLRDEFFVNGARSIGIVDFLPKPFTKESLTSTVQQALNRRGVS